METGFAPLFTGQVFFRPPGLHWRDSREAAEREVWHFRASTPGATDTRHGARRFLLGARWKTWMGRPGEDSAERKTAHVIVTPASLR